MTKLIPILSGRCLVVEMPEGATDAKINPVNSWRQELACWDGHRWKDVSLPKGNWRIIGMLSEVTEDGLDGLIEPVKVFDYDAHYWNYKDKEYQPIRVYESLESAIEAEGHLLESPPTPKCGCFGPPEEGICPDCDEYMKDQSRVLDRSRCLLLGRVG